MTSSLGKVSLKPKLRSFSAAKLDSTTTKDDIKAPGIIIMHQKPSARENEVVYEK